MYTEKDLNNYNLYMQYVRHYVCDKMVIDTKLKDKLEFGSVEIKRSGDIITDNSKWIFDVNYNKRKTTIEVVSFQKWFIMMDRNEKFKSLGIR